MAKTPAPLQDQAIWTELGLQESGEGTYMGPNGRYTLTLYRLQDPTAALAAFDWQRPRDSRPDKIAALAAAAPGSLTVASGNYLAIWKSHKPAPEEINHLFLVVPHFQNGMLPALPGFLPSTGLKANSERYIIGPATLAKFYPEIPPAVAAFRFNAEALTADYGNVRLAIFSYPTFEIARKQDAEFQKIPGAIVKRTGPLVAVTIHPPDANEAERVLSRVRYQAEVTVPEKPPTPRDNPINLLWNILKLIGILIVFCGISGLVFGGLRQVIRRFGSDQDGEAMLLLHLTDRR